VTPPHHEVRHGLPGAPPGPPFVGLELDADGMGVEVLASLR
jgi:hypothetical protein